MNNFKIVGKKLIIPKSNKKQPLLNASKVWQTVPTGPLKKRKSKKQLKSNNKSWGDKNELYSKTKKVKQLDSQIPNLKDKLLSSESTIKKYYEK